MNELLILVDEQDNEVGVLDKLSVHQKGVLHRAFSVFIFNSLGRLLLQQRADEKYHSAGLWSNTCCSHPRKGEKIQQAIDRRLMEEMGLRCDTDFAFSFTYRMPFGNGLTEHEFDHVYFGTTDDVPVPNAREVKDIRYVTLRQLEKEITAKPQNYTAWLKICLPAVIRQFDQRSPLNTSLDIS